MLARHWTGRLAQEAAVTTPNGTTITSSPSARDTALMQALIDVGRPIILESFSPDSCIASTRIGLAVLTYFGIAAKEYPVSITVLNKDAMQFLAEHDGDLFALKAETMKYAVEDRGGPWTVGLGAPDLPELRPNGTVGWPGHLVIGMRRWDRLLDLSLDQVSRPHKNMPLGATMIDVPEHWWDITEERQPTVLTDGTSGTVLLLMHRHDTNYRKAPNWKGISGGDKYTMRAVTAQIIKALRGQGFTPTR